MMMDIMARWTSKLIFTISHLCPLSICRVEQSLLVEAHLTLLSMMGKFLCLARFLTISCYCKWPNSPEIYKDIMDLLLIHFIQANNAYIFPGFGLGLIMSGAIRVHDDMLLAACKYLWRIINDDAYIDICRNHLNVVINGNLGRKMGW